MTDAVEHQLWSLFREFLERGERTRRWSVERDVDWSTVSSVGAGAPAGGASAPPSGTTTAMGAGVVSAEIVDIVESFFAVELFLPDYVSEALRLLRSSRGRAWMQAAWGYEECRHSLALETWLVRSCRRTERQLEEFADACLATPWTLPYDEPRKLLAYQMIQELSTAVSYRHLRDHADAAGDDALSSILRHILIDERAHYQFFRDAYRVMLADDRDGAISDLHFVLGTFEMPARRCIPGFEARGARMEQARVFDATIFVKEVTRVIYAHLDVPRRISLNTTPQEVSR